MQRDVASVLMQVPHYSLNKYINLCPSCGRRLNVDAEWLNEDSRHKVKLVERSLTCSNCKIKIRQVVYLV